MDITGKKKQELIDDLTNRVLNLENNIRNNNAILKERTAEAEALKSASAALGRELKELKEENERLKASFSKELKELKEENDRLKAAAAKTASDIKSLERAKSPEQAEAAGGTSAEKAEDAGAGAGVSGEMVYDTLDYFDFEDHFRGPKEVIRQRQLQYLPYFEGKNNVLDIGCGRGEFLELLKEKGIDAKGVDFFEPFAEYGKLNGLDITCGDGIAYLKGLEDDSLGGIMCAQVVEHLKTEQIITLCNEAFKKLKKGSYLIIETPNPRCLSIYTNSFYVDPSHVKPVHPDSLMYYLEKAGFSGMKLVETKESRCGVDIPELKAEGIGNLAEFNSLMKRLGQKVWGSQDYAMIAEK